MGSDLYTLRPSGAARWLACPGSVALCRELPERPAGDAANEGTTAHWVAEQCLKNGECEANAYLGETHVVDGKAYTVDAEMVEGVNTYLDTVYSVLRNEDHLHVEQGVTAVEPRNGYRVKGTSDCIVWKPATRHVHVFDLKYGAGLVEVENNKQALTYAAGAVAHLRDMGEQPPGKVTVWIIQPRASHPRGPVRPWEVPFFDFLDFNVELLETVDAIAAGATELKSGPQCKYCDAAFAGTCPVQKQQFENVFASIVPPSTVEGFDAAEIGRQLDQAEQVEGYIANLRERAEKLALAGDMPAGRKWVRGRGQRAWAVPEDIVIATFRDRLGAEIAETKIICKSPAQAELAVGKKQFAIVAHPDEKEKKLRPDAVPLVKKSEGKLQLVKESDPREAVDPNATVFEAID